MLQRIEETPVLKGEDAARFREEMKKLESDLKNPAFRREKAEELKKMKQCADYMRSLSHGAF